MNKDFKRKLEDYTAGNLSEKDRLELEEELDKVETYQLFLEKQLEKDKISDNKLNKSKDNWEAKIIWKSKWKVRLQNAFTTLIIALITYYIMGFVTMVYYSWGTPDKSTVYADVVKATIAVTQPNIKLGSQAYRSSRLFTFNMQAELKKEIGTSTANIGKLNTSFFFNKLDKSEWKLTNNTNTINFFKHPLNKSKNYPEGWSVLEKLPEGTVTEAYLSFNQVFEIEKIFNEIKNKDVKPLWFAVDTGAEDISKCYSPIGFSYQPVLLRGDYEAKIDKDQKNPNTKYETLIGPNLVSYGDVELRKEIFMRKMQLLKQYENIAQQLVKRPLDLDKRLDYLNKNGIKIYGVVVTGPTKEILKLKNEAYISEIKVNDVQFWNWD